MRLAPLPAASLASLLFLSIGHDARADDPVAILVLREHSVGSAIQAQPYVDRFVAITAKQNGWVGAKGEFHTTRSGADAFIQSSKPSYGILSLSAFLALRSKYGLEVIGQVDMARAGGQEYHVISKTASDLAGCKGKTLATNHADDPKFIELIVAAGKFKLSDFNIVETPRPVQTIKKVVSGDAECALIDDAQSEELAHVEGAASIKSVWKSAKLPPMVVANFPSAPAAHRKAFQASLHKLCAGEGKQACVEVGISALKAASSADYAAVIASYEK